MYKLYTFKNREKKMRLIILLASTFLLTACAAKVEKRNVVFQQIQDIRNTFEKMQCKDQQSACLGEIFTGYGYHNGVSSSIKMDSESLIVFTDRNNRITSIQLSDRHRAYFYSYKADTDERKQKNKKIESFIQRVYDDIF